MGEGKPLLFLHGYGATKETFNYQLKYFSNYFKVYAPDLPGFKQPLKYPYDIYDYAKIVNDFIVETGENEFYVIAHSFGARIVLCLSPYKKFKKIVFTGPAGLKPKRKIGYFFKIWGYKSIKAVFGEEKAHCIFKKRLKNGVLEMSKINRQSFVKIVNQHFDHKLKDISVPTLIVQGNKDAETPLYFAKRFYSGIKDSGLVIIDGGHFAFIDNPNAFNIIVKDFLYD